MSLPVKQQDVLLNRGFSRRQVGRIASLLTAGAALPFYNEFAMAQDAERRMMRGAGGAGLGLTLAKSIVEAHGGTVAVTSDVGVGTTVRVMFPGAAQITSEA